MGEIGEQIAKENEKKTHPPVPIPRRLHVVCHCGQGFVTNEIELRRLSSSIIRCRNFTDGDNSCHGTFRVEHLLKAIDMGKTDVEYNEKEHK